MRDKVVQERILIRVRQIHVGNFGDCEAVGEGVTELRVHVGAVYRGYFSRHGKSVVICFLQPGEWMPPRLSMGK